MRAASEFLRIHRRTLDHPDARALVDEVQAEYVEMYGRPDGSPIDASEFAPGVGAFLVGHVSDGSSAGEPVASGAWRWVSTPDSLGGEAAGRTVELKRMFVRKPYRRSGLARAMLAQVEADAVAAGASLIVLETGPLQLAAVALYRDAGYVPLVDFGHYQHMGAHAFFKRAQGVGKGSA